MKQQLQARFISSIDRNLDELSPFYACKLHEMVELTGLRNEIVNCLLLELYQAAIFCTNHFLERLIKVALIKNHTAGYNYLQPEMYNQKIEESKKLFDSLTLHKSLECAFKKDLISVEEMKELSELRKKMRNPYSHAEIAKINETSPATFKGFMFNLDDIKAKLTKGEEIGLPPPIELSTFSPAFAQLHQEHNSKASAFGYFKKVHSILLEIEKRIRAKR
jgi:hypothetical protein